MNSEKNSLPLLPMGWVWTDFESIATTDRNAIVDGPFGSNLKLSDYIENTEGVPVLTTKNLENGYNDRNLRYISKEKFLELNRSEVKGGDILVAKIGSCGKAAIYPEGHPTAMIPANLLKMTVHPTMTRLYVFYYLTCPSFKAKLKDITTATAQPAFNVTKFRKLPLPLSPLPEQHRIVAKIEELFTRLDAGVDALTKIKLQLKRYRQSILKSAFEGKLTADWREVHKGELEPASVLLEKVRAERAKSGKYKELPPINTSDLPEPPDGWVWTRIGEIAWFKNGINFNSHQKGNKGIPTIDVFNMYSSNIRINLDSIYRVDTQPSDDYLLKNGDILFVRSSVKREGVGWASLFDTQRKEPTTYCGFIIKARLFSNELHPEYLTYLLRTASLRRLIIGSSSQVTITNITQDALAKITVPLPSFAEQHHIVEEIERYLSVADQIEKVIEQSLQQSDKLRRSILKKAFEGKIAPQDPNDEPAEKLLERIKTEKARQQASDIVTRGRNKRNPSQGRLV